MFCRLTLPSSIHNSITGGSPVSRGGRWLLAACGLALAVILALAVTLEPDPRGYGTHERLGFPACTFRTIWNVPCPSCGMTTSFALVVRGRLPEAARANAAGSLFALICAAGVPWLMTAAAVGRYPGVRRPQVALAWLLAALGLVALANWAFRLTLG